MSCSWPEKVFRIVRDAISQTYGGLAAVKARGRRGETHSDELVLGAGSEVLAVRAEADAPDVQVAAYVDRVVLEDAELVAGPDVVDLRGPVAARGDVLAVLAEADAAHDALVRERVDQIHVERARHRLVEDDEPVVARLLEVGREALHVQVAEGVAGVGHLQTGVGGRVRGHLGRLARAGIRHRRVDLGSSRTTRRRPAEPAPPRTGRRRGLRGLRGKTAHGALGVLLEGRLLRRRRRRRRRPLQARGRLAHGVLGWLLVLRGRRRRRSQAGVLAGLPAHDGAEDVARHADGGRLRRAGVLRRTADGTLGRRGAPASAVELAAKVADLVFVPGRENGCQHSGMQRGRVARTFA